MTAPQRAGSRLRLRLRLRLKLRLTLRPWQAGLLLAVLLFWWARTRPGLLPNILFDNDRQASFFFG